MDGIRFQAPWDTYLTVVTVSVVAFTIVVVGLVASAVLRANGPGLAALVVAITVPAFASFGACYWWSPRAYSIDGKRLVIERAAGGVTIPMSSIRSVEQLEGGRRFRRILGNDGLFGYYGQFSDPELGAIRLYATRKEGRVALATGTETIVVTPDRPEAFIAEVRRLTGS